MLRFKQYLREKAPPGREDQVKALKGKVDNPYAVAWASYNKSKKKKKVNEEYVSLRERRMQHFDRMKVINA